ncbi:hypothetical protein ACO2RV_19605 [Ancylobacter sp. VNQ12]|uniref:hypothetical protein n=1 Tax=Ancylobacter sp. VNQ12 TaxID=3400920 RepID=UPI003C0C93EE
MMRSFSRSPLPARRPLALRFAAPPLLALTLVAPAGAQTIGAATPATSAADPWNGIAVVITPPADDTSPYEAAQDADAEPTQPETATAAPEEPEADDHAPSLWTILTLGLGGETPEPPKEEPAPNQLISRPKPAVAKKTSDFPTSLELKQGPASVAITTTASGSAPSSGPLNASAGGASGEVKGRVGLEQDNLSIYSTGTLGASASTSSPTLSDNLAVGSSYSVPLAPLGLGQEKLGASVEVDNSHTLTTGVELRAPLGTYERFISVERSTPADSSASGVVKAGVLGKF